MKLFSILAFSLFTIPAFANGVEKITLPRDAKNIALLSVKVEQAPIESKDEEPSYGSDLEGTPRGTLVTAPKLWITFAFDSNSSQSSGSGPDGQSYSWDDSRAQVSFFADASDGVLSAVQAGKLAASDLVSFAVANEPVIVSTKNPDPAKQCAFNYETGMNVDSNCDDSVEVTEVLPVLSVELK